ncbi:hypothetical protein [Lyngbya confervoides]|uniref:Uncharacterized protein n=1 Tax=Lyngbya confervoides BDU141951 TaxID=1574623 RepID=A0ABD4T8B5_9CYAN|nr:hypothetical protein [Lyngbya confervoides]MCM1984861.1 hypothetical protein [Lyngbya confervoides BDU141951]
MTFPDGMPPEEARFSPHSHWNEAPLPDSTPKAADLATLRRQLQSAQELLAYQQSVIDSLTQQVSERDTLLARSEQQIERLQKQADLHQLELAEVRSICGDLRMQLQRHLGRRVSPPLSQGPAPDPSQTLPEAVPPKGDLISFGYESMAAPMGSTAAATKAPPVQVWSAKPAHGCFQSAFSAYRKLTTFIVASATLDNPAPTLSHLTRTPSRLELPRFATR